MLKIENHILGRTDEKIAIESSEDHRQAALRMAEQTRRSIAIISRNLDPSVYDTAEFVEAVKQLVLLNRYTHVRALVFDPLSIVKRGHRLFELMLSLTSFIEFRVPSFEYDGFNEPLFVADEVGYILRSSMERYEGALNFNDALGARILMKQFEEMWGKAKPDPNLKRVNL
jgi:hypothetical protein